MDATFKAAVRGACTVGDLLTPFVPLVGVGAADTCVAEDGVAEDGVDDANEDDTARRGRTLAFCTPISRPSSIPSRTAQITTAAPSAQVAKSNLRAVTSGAISSTGSATESLG